MILHTVDSHSHFITDGTLISIADGISPYMLIGQQDMQDKLAEVCP